jgi:hypothetical protein
MSTNKNVNKQKCQQTKMSTNKNVNKQKCQQTKMSKNENVNKQEHQQIKISKNINSNIPPLSPLQGVECVCFPSTHNIEPGISGAPRSVFPKLIKLTDQSSLKIVLGSKKFIKIFFT